MSFSILLLLAVLCHGLVTAQTYSNGTIPSAQVLIQRAITALGGEENLQAIAGITYIGQQVYRTRTLMQSYSLTGVDHAVSGAGRQNISLSFDQPYIQERIDRFHQIDSYWVFGRTSLLPFEYSLVINGGPEGFACVVRGSNDLFLPNRAPAYTDGLQAAYFIHEANQISPVLLRTVQQNNASTSGYETVAAGLQFPAVHNSLLNLTIIFNPETSLPHIIRSFEDHPIFGASTQDLMVYDYTEVEGVLFPRRFKTVYNNEHVISDYLVDQVVVNPQFEATTFQGIPQPPASAAPRVDQAYPFAEIGEWTGVNVWRGAYTGTFANISATQPYPELPGLWVLEFSDAPGTRQVVLEFQDAVFVLDAPPHQSLLVIQWVTETLRRTVTHVWPSHHHHDHALGTRDYAAVGATIVTVQEAEAYYSNINGAQFTTYTSDAPFTHSDSTMRVAIATIDSTSHASDQSYALITTPCASGNATVALFEADAWSPSPAQFGEHIDATQFLLSIANDKVPRNTRVVPSHGSIAPLTTLINTLGFPYPQYSASDYKFRDSACPAV